MTEEKINFLHIEKSRKFVRILTIGRFSAENNVLYLWILEFYSASKNFANFKKLFLSSWKLCTILPTLLQKDSIKFYRSVLRKFVFLCKMGQEWILEIFIYVSSDGLSFLRQWQSDNFSQRYGPQVNPAKFVCFLKVNSSFEYLSLSFDKINNTFPFDLIRDIMLYVPKLYIKVSNFLILFVI